MNLFNLFAKISLDTKDYDKGINEAGKKASSFSSKLGTAFKTSAKVVGAMVGVVTAVAGALVKITTSTINYGDEIDKTSQKLGLSAEAFQKWNLYADMSGTSAETLQTGIRQLTQFYQDLEDGQGDALLALQKLGIGYDDFMEMNNDERLYAIVTAMQGLEDGTDKTRLAQELFGQRAYQELMPMFNDYKGSIDEAFQSYEDLGLIMSDDMVDASATLNDNIALMKASFRGLTTDIGTSLYPALQDIIGGLTGIATGSEGATDQLVKGFIGVADKITESLPDFIETAGTIVFGIVDGIMKMLPDLIKNLVPIVNKLILGLLDYLPTITENTFTIFIALIEGLLALDWGEIIVKIIETIIKIATEVLPNVVGKLIDIVVGLIEGLLSKEGLSRIANIGKRIGEALINGVIALVESGINLIIKGLNAITSGISKAWDWTGFIPSIPAIPNVTLPKVEFKKFGGMLDDILGTIYVAGESGTEIVAQGSRGTGVANIDQISEAQYNAMRDYGIKETIQNAVSGIVNGIVGGLSIGTNDKNNVNVVVKIGERDITDIVNKSIYATGRRSLYKTTEWK